MNAEKAAIRRIARRMAEGIVCRTGAPQWRARVLRVSLLALAAGSAAQAAFAQDPRLLDTRVTQESVTDTICRPGYADTVAPPFDQTMALKDRMLAARGIDSDEGVGYALDRHVPIVLGGSPDATANFDLIPWGGHAGERRKSLLTVRLKRCVCAGRMTLAEAQAAITGNWVHQYDRLTRMDCGGSADETTSASRDDGS
ncbi:hypothetical protein [Paraburkholderia flagellata]|uniref:hypothetical protein n=1 Tax=Paraburkholderia flagellata TaxID=2883241 RepID=UPI001F1E5DAC|nr:hypothetical protein [Paraburkholderia flagellata]